MEYFGYCGFVSSGNGFHNNNNNNCIPPSFNNYWQGIIMAWLIWLGTEMKEWGGTKESEREGREAVFLGKGGDNGEWRRKMRSWWGGGGGGGGHGGGGEGGRGHGGGVGGGGEGEEVEEEKEEEVGLIYYISCKLWAVHNIWL